MLNRNLFITVSVAASSQSVTPFAGTEAVNPVPPWPPPGPNGSKPLTKPLKQNYLVLFGFIWTCLVLVGFAWPCSSESGFFNGLRAKR
jgi:hypothetical protein